MAKLLLVLVAALAVVSAQQKDELESIASNVMKGIHAHAGGEGGENALYANLLTRTTEEALGKTRRDRIEEAVGQVGATFVSVTKGKKQVNVTTVYGVGAGGIANIRDKKRSTLGEELAEPTANEVTSILQPLYEKYVKNLVEGETGDAVVVHIGSEGKRDLNLRDKTDDVLAKGRGGFRVGARTVVSKRG